jgi:HK97 family phage prohead protease
MPKAGITRSAQVRTIDEEGRSLEAVASTEAVDAYGTILRANWDLARFSANPVLLYAHNANGLPVGACADVRLEGKDLVFRAVFDDANDFDEQVWQKYKRRVLRGFSVRFNPIEQRVIEQNGKQIIEYTRSELMEISCTPLPGNAEALARSAGMKSAEGKREAMRTTTNHSNIESRIAKLEREATSRAVEASLESIPPEFRDVARSLPPDAAKGLVKALVRDARTATGIPVADERKLDSILGTRTAEPETIGYGAADPIRGVRTFQAPSPGKIRAAKLRARR